MWMDARSLPVSTGQLCRARFCTRRATRVISRTTGPARERSSRSNSASFNVTRTVQSVSIRGFAAHQPGETGDRVTMPQLVWWTNRLEENTP